MSAKLSKSSWWDATCKRDPFTELVPRYLTPSELPTERICRQIRIPDDPRFTAAINELISRLGFEDIWEQSDGGLETWQAAALGAQMYDDYNRSYCMIGVIVPSAIGTLPDHMLDCDGSSYARADYPDLYSVLDATYIIDADTFRVPDLRGRAAIGTGTGDDLTARALDDTGGEETHVLTEGEMPAHSHTIHGYGLTARVGALDTYDFMVRDVTLTNLNTDNTGGDDPHNNMQPFIALRYVIIAK